MLRMNRHTTAFEIENNQLNHLRENVNTLNHIRENVHTLNHYFRENGQDLKTLNP